MLSTIVPQIFRLILYRSPNGTTLFQSLTPQMFRLIHQCLLGYRNLKLFIERFISWKNCRSNHFGALHQRNSTPLFLAA